MKIMTFLELGFEDQKIDFDLFVEDKPAPEQNVCLQVMEMCKVRKGRRKKDIKRKKRHM